MDCPQPAASRLRAVVVPLLAAACFAVLALAAAGAAGGRPAEAAGHPFELIGKHATLTCDRCHQPGKPQPRYVCQDCHQPPSQPHNGDNCAGCHSPAGFKAPAVTEPAAPKPAEAAPAAGVPAAAPTSAATATPAWRHPIELAGRHSAVACDRCHTAERPKPAYVCRDCHRAPKAHFGNTCADCHTTAGFRGAALPRGQHPVGLIGAHSALACDRCHTTERPKPAYVCRDCHEPPSPPHFGDECSECHDPAGFAGAQFPREKHPVELTGRHESADCAGCHASPGSKPSQECRDCHQPPSPPHFGDDCAGCHTTDGFDGAELPRQEHPFPISGKHAGLDCQTCHTDPGSAPSCTDCHRPPGWHTRNDCTSCHTPGESWKAAGGSDARRNDDAA